MFDRVLPTGTSSLLPTRLLSHGFPSSTPLAKERAHRRFLCNPRQDF
jgi:hypothetical protein